jgi:uncharacterized Zn finger protein
MPVTEVVIRSLATAQSFERGESYYHSGAVLGLSKRGDTLLAHVEGSSYEPYEVTVELSEQGVMEAYCTCPYDWGGYCKHIVAALLAYIREPDRVIERQAVADLLADLGRDELLDLLTELLSKQPRLVDWLEMELSTQTAEVSTGEEDQPRQRQTPIDPEPFRKRAQYIMSSLSGMRPSEAYWHTGGMADDIQSLINQAGPFIEAGDGRNALLILEAVTQVYVDRWLEYDDSDGYLGGLFADFGRLFTEAILSADLSPEEREEWADRLTVWQAEIEDYGIDEAFDAAIGAAVQGWDFPPLQAVLGGYITNQGAWEDEVPWYADHLALARLNVLERQGRTDEYLYLAEAEGQTALHLTMLVKLGRVPEAVEYAMQYLATTDDALALAQALREHDQPVEALKIAEHGLTLHGETSTLARWTRDFAAGTGQPALAFKAARAAFARSCSLEDYQAAQALAGEDWPSVKPELLDLLAAHDYAYRKINIYLYEGMVDDAVQAVDRDSYPSYSTVEPVVDAAWQSHPDWAIRQCKKQAEPIMDGGKSKHYHHAVRWLEKARRAYLGAGREDEWRDYLEGLIRVHARKYSLRPQLEALRE